MGFVIDAALYNTTDVIATDFDIVKKFYIGEKVEWITFYNNFDEDTICCMQDQLQAIELGYA